MATTFLFTCEAGTLSCLNKKDGKRTMTVSNRGAAALHADDCCRPRRAGWLRQRLHIIDVATARKSDTVEIDAPTGSTPAMRDERVYFGTEGGTFYAISIPAARDKKASVAWTYRDPQRNQPIRAAAAVSDQFVAFGSQGKAIYGLDPANGEEKWKCRRALASKVAGDRRQSRSRRDHGR